MNFVLNFFKYIIDLGPGVMMPIIITLLGVALGQKFSKAFRAGVTVGIAFTGLNLVIALMLDTVSPIVTTMVDNYGFHLTGVDVGWPVGATLAWGTIVVPFVFVAILVTNIIMLVFNWTKTMDIDIWNYWHALFTASIIYQVTNSMVLAIASSVINMAIIFKIADWTQKDVQEVLGLEGISLPHIQSTSWALIDYPANWILDKIPGVNKINWTTEGVQEKLGILGEPMMLGLIIGFALPAAARMPLSGILKAGIAVASVLVLLPKMISLLMEGLMVISEGAHEFMEKRFPGREVYIGLDAAVGIGHPFVVAVALIIIPITLVLAFILPGNTILPLADLSALPFYVIFSIVPNRGNLFRGIVIGTVNAAIMVMLASVAAPLMTELGVKAGLSIPEGATQITCLAVGAQWYTWFAYWGALFLHNVFGI